MQKRFVFGVLLVIIGILAGSTAVFAQDALPALADLPAGEWTEIATGGETSCAYGDPYRFFVRPAAEPSDKLLIYFAGGGACWNAENCAPSFAGPDGNPIFVSQVPEGSSAALTQGFFNYENDANPVGDYNAVYVTYCSADVHSGSNRIDYESSAGEKYTLNHVGAINATAALDWTFENFDSPSNVVVSGCSAGSYGSILHSARIMQQYAGTPVMQIGDAGVGVVTDTFDGLASWGFYDNLPDIGGLREMDPTVFRTKDLYKATAAAFPDNTVSQITGYLDTVQIGFFYLMGGGATPEEAGANWLLGMRSIMSGLSGSVRNFRGLMFGGGQHCITPYDEMYSYQVNGQPLVDWVAGVVNGERPRTLNCLSCNEPEVAAGS
ncbi:MAG: hypothetical protein JNJ61_17875 [Anaerolineae bacterium]|nr:hypothetical protein [Anaerolineae bacterium]